MQLERHIAERLHHAAPRGALCVGLSGGLDSVVLLDLSRVTRATPAVPFPQSTSITT
jgi:tRNA(Ile)-lysidine synthase TilS/MesJ